MNPTEAQEIAFDFLMDDLEISEEDREWFTIVSSRLSTNGWYTAIVGLKGLPDHWILQVFDTGVCDPCYTFNSPLKGDGEMTDLEILPKSLAEVLIRERQTI